MLTILRNAEVYAPAALGRRHIVIGGGKVLWIGAETPAIDGALLTEEINLDGARLIPGLIDCHVHLTGGGGEDGFSSRVPPLRLSDFTTAGITSVVGLLGTDAETRNASSLLAAARGLREEGLNTWCWTGGYQLPPSTVTGSIRGDITQIDAFIGLGELALSDHRSCQPTLDQLLQAAGEAHVAGLLTGKAGIVHLHMGDGERGLDLVRRALDTSELPARLFHPTHVNRRRALFEEALQLTGRGCAIDVTAFPDTVNEDELGPVEAIERYLDADLPAQLLTVSSDAGGSLPEFGDDGRLVRSGVGSPAALTGTLRTLLQDGRSLEDVLPAFTANVAALLRLPGKGQIEAEADADLAILDDDGSVADVMIGGRWHIRGGEPVITGRFE